MTQATHKVKIIPQYFRPKESKYKLLVNDEFICFITERQAVELCATIEDEIDRKKQIAQQNVVNTIGTIALQSQHDIACIAQQISELAEIEVDESKIAEDVTDNIPFF